MPSDQDLWPLRRRLVRRVRREVGVAEATGKNDGVPADRYCGGRCERWCGHFAAWARRAEGHPLPGDRVPTLDQPNPVAWVAEMVRLAKVAKLWREHGAYDPQPGDLIVYYGRAGSDDPTLGGNHVGTITDVHVDRFETVDGNWDNRVALRSVPRDDATIWGYVIL